MKTSHRPLLPMLLLLMLLTACRATVQADTETAGADTRPVFLVEHGWHTSVVLTREDDTLVRFVYGDWRWYAKADTGVLRAFPTLFLRTQGALGRRALDGAAEAGTIMRRSTVAIDAIHTLSAPAERLDALIGELDQRFDAARDTLSYSAGYDLEFVHDDKPYTLFDNSNHVAAGWLRSLGIDVRGNPVFGRWRVHP